MMNTLYNRIQSWGIPALSTNKHLRGYFIVTAAAIGLAAKLYKQLDQRRTEEVLTRIQSSTLHLRSDVTVKQTGLNIIREIMYEPEGCREKSYLNNNGLMTRHKSAYPQSPVSTLQITPHSPQEPDSQSGPHSPAPLCYPQLPISTETSFLNDDDLMNRHDSANHFSSLPQSNSGYIKWASPEHQTDITPERVGYIWTPDIWTPDIWTPDIWTPDIWTPGIAQYITL